MYGNGGRKRGCHCGSWPHGSASLVYMSNIDTDRRPAPTQEYLDRMAAEFALGKEEYELLLDLAAKSKR